MQPGGGGGPEELLRRARRGDRDGLGRLLERYRNYLRMLAKLQVSRHLQSKADASDLVQETFVEAHRAFARFRGSSEADLLQWLRRILASRVSALVRRFLRTGARDVRLERQLEAELDGSSRLVEALAVSPSSPSQKAVQGEQAVLLADAIGQLPAHYQEVIVLRHLEQLSFPEVARRMQRSLDSVKNLWIRALAALDRLLGEPGDD